ATPSAAAMMQARTTSGRGDLAGGLEQLVAAPARDLAAGREPHAVRRLHVADDGAQRACAAGPAGDVRVELEGGVGRGEPRFLVEVVEQALPDVERIDRIAGVALAV